MGVGCKQIMMVRWNSSHSGRLCISNRVKQGQSLFINFSVYLDELLKDLRALNSGCYMNGIFVGAVIYADDIH